MTCRVYSQLGMGPPRLGTVTARRGTAWSHSTGTTEASPTGTTEASGLEHSQQQIQGDVCEQWRSLGHIRGWGCWAEAGAALGLPQTGPSCCTHHSPGVIITGYTLHQPLQATLQRIIARGGQKTKFAFFCHFQNLFANITFLFYLFRENYTILHSTV